jgi:NitT/TauT family transport system ATP-binding protein
MHIPASSSSHVATQPQPGQGPVIQLRDVCHTYASGERSVIALENISFDIGAHQFVSILGPSGCGKSTLLRMLAGLLGPSSGEVRINGLSPVVARERGLLGLVFQSPVLLPWRDVLSNVAFLLELQKVPRAQREARARECIELAGLAGFERHRPWQLSGGMQQRASIARALAFDPSILLMDEPFGALDAITRDRMAFDLLDIWKRERKTVVFVTHSVQEAALLSDRVIVMTSRPGRIHSIRSIDIARPRRREQMLEQDFIAHTRQLMEDLQAHYR